MAPAWNELGRKRLLTRVETQQIVEVPLVDAVKTAEYKQVTFVINCATKKKNHRIRMTNSTTSGMRLVTYKKNDSSFPSVGNRSQWAVASRLFEYPDI